ncbi:MAG: SusD/RagB family nutrient-binding outer membrane lipoprotein [bacterium]
MRKQLTIFLLPLFAVGLVLVFGLEGCSTDFLQGHDVDPNNPTEVTIDQLFTGVQVNSYRQLSGQLSRTAAMWTQQMAGTDRQFVEYDKYIFTEDDYNDEMDNWYTGGGLIDIRAIIEQSSEVDNQIYTGYGKFYEAWFIGTCSSIWGDIPYSEAVSNVATPKLDRQADAYNAVQRLLDEAIAGLGSGSGRNPGELELGYNGDVQKMIAAAHTLKARFYMHWTEVDPSNYAKALAEANQGISSIANNLNSVHNAADADEWSMWYQFYDQRDSYIRAGKFMVDLLKARNDPRLTIYYEPLPDGQVIGADIAEQNPGGTSLLGEAFRGAGAPFPLITYEENELIKAECNFKLGDEATALQNLNNVRAAVAAKWNITYPALSGLSGQALLDEILTERYISLFLQIEVWHDYKRNCFPRLQTYQGQPIPGRLFYSNNERNVNSNIPAPAAQPARNANDPNACP